MKNAWALLSAPVLAAALTAAPPASAADGSLPAGTAITVDIDTPSEGQEFVIPAGDSSVDVPVEGTASVGEGVPVKDTTLVFVMDVSGSMSLDAGVDCDGTPGTETRLQCEQHGVATVNEAAAQPRSTVDLVGLASFSGDGQAHDVNLGAPGTQLLVAPDHDGNGNGTPDVEDVAFGLTASGRTNYAAGLQAAFGVVDDTANTNSTNSVVFMSDGANNRGANVDTLSGPAGTAIDSFALGEGVNCSSDPTGRGSLDDVAALSTSGTGSCRQVRNLSELADTIEESRGATLDRLELTVDGGAPAVLSNTETHPDLPANGPVTVDYATTASSLAPGSHELCVTAFGEDAGGKGSINECVNVRVVQGILIDIKPGSDPNSINVNKGGVTPVAALTTDTFDATTIDVDSVCFGDAGTPGERDCEPAHDGHLEDVDGDADTDLVLHFETRQTGIDAGETRACLTGETTSGTPVEGCDSVRTVPRHA